MAVPRRAVDKAPYLLLHFDDSAKEQEALFGDGWKGEVVSSEVKLTL